jgi:hypothetical protein
MKLKGANNTLNEQVINWSEPTDSYQFLLLQMKNPRTTQSMIISMISNAVIVLFLSIDVESN